MAQALVTMVSLLAFALLISGKLHAQVPEAADALRLIRETADGLCERIPLERTNSGMRLSGQAEAELRGVLARLSALGVRGAVQYEQTAESRAVLEGDIVRALGQRDTCKLSVFHALIDRLLPTHRSQAPSNVIMRTNIEGIFIGSLLEQISARRDLEFGITDTKEVFARKRTVYLAGPQGAHTTINAEVIYNLRNNEVYRIMLWLDEQATWCARNPNLVFNQLTYEWGRPVAESRGSEHNSFSFQSDRIQVKHYLRSFQAGAWNCPSYIEYMIRD
ncbi:hypothetical protein [Siccirubricoccus sp. G192]|uniref:hypothetical protein n=1 Tax=Siccirubricoccus sp. G192 TaxID=2849651 RepID=UPI001C2BEF40|nr:hypothetical protein [Siccirubricoccus sp. G192]MBV1799652.1 hypothetical protein [Siccirubricoccus sp. G192]